MTLWSLYSQQGGCTNRGEQVSCFHGNCLTVSSNRKYDLLTDLVLLWQQVVGVGLQFVVVTLKVQDLDGAEGHKLNVLIRRQTTRCQTDEKFGFLTWRFDGCWEIKGREVSKYWSSVLIIIHLFTVTQRTHRRTLLLISQLQLILFISLISQHSCYVTWSIITCSLSLLFINYIILFCFYRHLLLVVAPVVEEV